MLLVKTLRWAPTLLYAPCHCYRQRDCRRQNLHDAATLHVCGMYTVELISSPCKRTTPNFTHINWHLKLQTSCLSNTQVIVCHVIECSTVYFPELLRLFIVEVDVFCTSLHSDTPRLVGLLWARDRPVAETPT
jgi:hypothetical protein